MKRVYVVSLGCAKNLVDTEVVLGNLRQLGIEITSDQASADLLLLNTCGFIEQARVEANDEIHLMQEKRLPNQKFVVMGCLPTRYELAEAYPFVDRFISIEEYEYWPEIASQLLNISTNNYCYNPERRLWNSSGYLYIKISEGCNNNCGYCAIPLIRGHLKSRGLQYITAEIKVGYSLGIREFILISQDTTSYGVDIGLTIIDLLKEVIKIAPDLKIRLLYLYPSLVTDQLIDLFKSSPQLIPFFDIPLQHSETEVLHSMKRMYTKEDIITLYRKLKTVPDAFIRTTLIAGYPTEKDHHFGSMLDFISDYPFDSLGAFPYSAEEDTLGISYPQLPLKVINSRYKKIYDKQAVIGSELNQQWINRVFDVTIESELEKKGQYTGRSIGQSPDGTGDFVISSKEILKLGQTIKAKVIKADSYNLYGEHVKSGEFDD